MLQALMGLMQRSRQSAPGGARTDIETANVSLDEQYALAHPNVSPGEYVSVTVTDSGPAPNPAHVTGMGDLLWAVERVESGEGMGLFMANSLVEQNGGRLEVSAAAKGGGRYRVLLPRAPEQEAGEGEAGRRRGDRRETALVVEDDETVLALVRRILDINGYEALAASSAEAAKALLEGREGDARLLVTAASLPGWSGLDLYDDLASRAPALKALFMTGFADDVSEGVCAARGLSVISKPFTPQGLMRKVREAVGGGEE